MDGARLGSPQSYMDIRILGPLEVLDDGQPAPLGGGRQRELLALLVVERNRPVSGDRIVEELWNGDAPATAAKVVQNLVSQLRRGLPARDVLHTRGHAYELTLDDDAVDATRFERLLDDGRRALAAGEPERAAATLREALALWRGPALGEFADHSWARNESARLDEQRLVALERRIEADMALGRHADVVGELEAAVAREPLREGPRAQLMLALYRSGRQAEALAAFADARRTLVSELGIEPGPALSRLHEQILRQDESLAAPEPHRAAPMRRRRRAGALLLAGGALLALAAGALLLTRDEPAEAPAAGTGQLVALDADTGRIERRIYAGRTPAAVAIHEGDAWAVDTEARTLLRVDRSGETVDVLATGSTPVDVAVAGDRIWVANGRRQEVAQALGPVADELVRLDPATRREEATVPLPAGGTESQQASPGHLAVSRDALWAITAEQSVVRIDPAKARITATARGLRAYAIAAGGAGVWALASGRTVVEFDERTGRIARRVKLPDHAASALAVGDDAVWVAGYFDGKLWRVGTRPGEVIGALDVDEGVGAIAVAGRTVWTANAIAGTVTAVDGAAMRIIRTVRVGGSPRWLAIDGETVWVAVTGTEAASTSSRVAGVTPLPASICEPVVAGPDGKADALVVSDLPLQGDARLDALEMSQAIMFRLRERGFRAGRLRLAYQSCDDALAGTGLFDEAKCAANGRAYAANRDVIGVIGTFNSACAVRLLPELNRAEGGPVGMSSPVNSFVGLTRPRKLPDELTLGDLYPTGRRNFVRIYPADDLQSGALAQLARDRGRQRVFILDDGEIGYSDLLADAFATAARRLGLDVVGHVTWDPAARDYSGLAERVARSGAEAVYVAGIVTNDAGLVIRALRARLGDGVDLMAPDGVAPPSLLRGAAGPAARGVFVTISGVPTEKLPPAGAAFARRFARTRPGETIEANAVYAAHATDVMLDAIARSDGTRGSVVDELFRTRRPDGLTGPVDFDARGDTVQGAVTILRVTDGKGSHYIASLEGAVVERVARLDPSLVEP
jgi:DNA-binding SARP family transcriptional activator/ABC-type branched-subunit amino acid transport system substrate-binding protein